MQLLLSIESREETPGLWQGYLWAPRLWPDLLLAMKRPLLEALANSSSLGDKYGRNLRRLFTFACLEIPYGFSESEVRSSLRALSADELADVVRALSNHLEHAADRAEEQWTKRVHPFIDRYWPQDNAHNSPAVSAVFSDLALKTGKEFPKAMSAIKKFLLPIDNNLMLPYRLREDCSYLVEEFPDAVLDLLYLTTPNAGGSHHGLRDVLERLLVARPNLKKDLRFQRLERVA